uniref:Tyrosine decarboxylase 1 n=1 Tax=Aegilops tauschii subsp. strangulata TaxID=200361 RepID=A0A452XLY4_AEGTS
MGALGEALTAGINVVPFTWAASPAATEREIVVVDWLGKALHLPKSLLFEGGGVTLLGTSSEAILCVLVAARDRKLAEVGEGRVGHLVVYCSDQTHFAFRKAAHVAGIGNENSCAIPAGSQDMYALPPAMLEATMKADAEAGMTPLFLCASIGTAATTAVDSIHELCAVASPHGVWVHVDAAYAGSALICPVFRHLVNGVEDVDSLSMNPHKWLLSNNDCCALWLKQPSALVAALGTDDDVILKDTAATADDGMLVDYKDWQISLTRRFRALKVWLVLRGYGTDGLRDVVRAHVRMAAAFQDMVGADARFEVVAPRVFSLVCFRLRRPTMTTTLPEDNELNRRLLAEVNATGEGPYMSCAVVGGAYVLRFAVGSTLTEERHVRDAWKVVQEHATLILASSMQNMHA